MSAALLLTNMISPMKVFAEEIPEPMTDSYMEEIPDDPVEEVQETLRKVQDAKNQVVGFVQTVKKVVTSIQSFFDRISGILDKFS